MRPAKRKPARPSKAPAHRKHGQAPPVQAPSGVPRPAPAGSTGHSPPPEPRRPEKDGRPEKARWPEKKREIGRDFLLGLVCTVVLIALKIWVGQSAFGQQVNLAAYTLIQRHLASTAPALETIRVVNLGDLSPQANPADRSGQAVTPRVRLRRLITDVVSQRPAAIGMDVDFSPDEKGYADPADPFFFGFCRRQGVPIFLGVKRSLPLPSRDWLGAEEYNGLAASLAGPPHDPRYYFASTTAAGADRPLPTLAARLFPYAAPPTRLPWPRWMAEQTGEDRPVDDTTPQGRALLAEKFSVDYSQLGRLMAAGENTPSGGVARHVGLSAYYTSASTPCDPRDVLCDKVVLIGDAQAKDGTDLFPLFGRMVPGVYIHACATYTLSRLPLYDLTPRGQVALDLLFSVPLLVGLACLRTYAARKWERPLAVERLQGVSVLLMVALVLVVGVGLVQRTRLLWDDFLLVVFALLLHPIAHRQIKILSSPRSWRLGSLLFEPKEEPERHETPS